MPSLTWRRSGAEVSFLRRDRTLEIPDEVDGMSWPTGAWRRSA
jgi:hypothetical protein